MKQETKGKLWKLLLAPIIIAATTLFIGLSFITIFESLNLDMTAGGILASQAPLLISGFIFFGMNFDKVKKTFKTKFNIKTILIGALITFVSILINTIVGSYLSKFIATEEIVSTTEMIVSSTSLITKILIPVIIAPFIEEFTFRAGLKSYLMDAGWGAKGYIVISSLLFGILHWQPGGSNMHIILTGILGFIWSVSYIKTDNIYIPIVSHSLYNFTIVMIASYQYQ